MMPKDTIKTAARPHAAAVFVYGSTEEFPARRTLWPTTTVPNSTAIAI
jgi:hypothetical protein